MIEERIVHLPDVDLMVVIDHGNLPTIFLHCFGGDLRTWNGLWPSLPCDRANIRYDLRGFGRSVARNDCPFHHVDDLLALIDALRFDQCDLVGLSMGGSIALNFALSWPDKVRSLALLSPGLTAWDWSEEWRMLWRPIVVAARAGEMRLARDLWLAHPLFETTRNSSRAAELLRDEVSAFHGAQWIQDHQAPALPDIERLHELAVPTLLLTGSCDFADFRLIADVIKTCAPNVIRHDASGLGHLIHLEAPHWCGKLLTAFWRETEARR